MNKNDSVDLIQATYCQCKAGNKSIGFCAHTACIVWYLSLAHYQEQGGKSWLQSNKSLTIIDNHWQSLAIFDNQQAIKTSAFPPWSLSSFTVSLSLEDYFTCIFRCMWSSGWYEYVSARSAFTRDVTIPMRYWSIGIGSIGRYWYWVVFLFLTPFVLVFVTADFPTKKPLLGWNIDFLQSLTKGFREWGIRIRCQMVKIMRLIFLLRKHLGAKILIFD